MKAALLRLVRLFPAPFRQRFGAELSEHLAREWDVARARGRAAALWHGVLTATDLVRSSIAERWRPAL
ncbi:MAG TPA: hypothetical protein VD793_07490, partial [Gemmatimonadales bacterium]|nr:hypothetical protein [Gemmatimonadales bacterium]